MSKVKLTQDQADFIQGFMNKYRNEPILEGKKIPLWVSEALHSISILGFGSFMKNAEGEQVTEYKKGFDHKDKLILIEAVIHGYEVEEPLKTAYMEFYNYAKGGQLDKVYYGTAHHTTSKDSATRFGIGWCPLEILEELKAQGWKVENYE